MNTRLNIELPLNKHSAPSDLRKTLRFLDLQHLSWAVRFVWLSLLTAEYGRSPINSCGKSGASRRGDWKSWFVGPKAFQTFAPRGFKKRKQICEYRESLLILDVGTGPGASGAGRSARIDEEFPTEQPAPKRTLHVCLSSSQL
jgi:hypothetical protein